MTTAELIAMLESLPQDIEVGFYDEFGWTRIQTARTGFIQNAEGAGDNLVFVAIKDNQSEKYSKPIVCLA